MFSLYVLSLNTNIKYIDSLNLPPYGDSMLIPIFSSVLLLIFTFLLSTAVHILLGVFAIPRKGFNEPISFFREGWFTPKRTKTNIAKGLCYLFVILNFFLFGLTLLRAEFLEIGITFFEIIVPIMSVFAALSVCVWMTRLFETKQESVHQSSSYHPWVQGCANRTGIKNLLLVQSVLVFLMGIFLFCVPIIIISIFHQIIFFLFGGFVGYFDMFAILFFVIYFFVALFLGLKYVLKFAVENKHGARFNVLLFLCGYLFWIILSYVFSIMAVIVA